MNDGKTCPDGRTPLMPGTKMNINGLEYVIQYMISFGGSCIAYSANRVLTNYEATIGIKTRLAIIKEFYPRKLSNIISRDGDSLYVTPNNQAAFDELKRYFEHGIASQVAYYGEDSNKALPPAQGGMTNNTIYSIVDLTQGDLLENYPAQLSMYDISEILISLCNAMKNIHNNGKLYLDLKPSNIFLFTKDRSESRRIALFDFDTLLSINDIATAAIPFSKGWSPYEQEHGQRSEITFASDIYAIGAIFYWLISGKEVTNEILDCIEWGNFLFLNECGVLRNWKNARITSERILSKTLKRDSKERV